MIAARPMTNGIVCPADDNEFTFSIPFQWIVNSAAVTTTTATTSLLTEFNF